MRQIYRLLCVVGIFSAIGYIFWSYPAIPAARLNLQITLQKRGDTAPPDDGVLVKKGETIQMVLNPGVINGQPLQVNWQFRQLKGDGTFTAWTNFYNSEGSVFNYVTRISGIFQVQAIVTVNGSPQAYPYLRQNTARYAANDTGITNPIYAQGQPDCFGVVDNQWQLDLRNLAEAQLGNTTWADNSRLLVNGKTYGRGISKCNLFVYQMCTAAGVSVPLARTDEAGTTKAPPLAVDWYHPVGIPSELGVRGIPGWKSLGNPDFPQPGEVISSPTGFLPVGGTLATPVTFIEHAHCGILDYDGAWINEETVKVNRYPNIAPPYTSIIANIHNYPSAMLIPVHCSVYSLSN